MALNQVTVDASSKLGLVGLPPAWERALEKSGISKQEVIAAKDKVLLALSKSLGGGGGNGNEEKLVVGTDINLSKEGLAFWGLMGEPHVQPPPPPRELSNDISEYIVGEESLFPYGMHEPDRHEKRFRALEKHSSKGSHVRVALLALTAVEAMRRSILRTPAERRKARQEHLIMVGDTRAFLRRHHPTTLRTAHRAVTVDDLVTSKRYEKPLRDATHLAKEGNARTLRSRLAGWLASKDILALKTFRLCDTNRNGLVECAEFGSFMKDELRVPLTSDELTAVFNLVSPSGDAITRQQWVSIFAEEQLHDWGEYVCRCARGAAYCASRDPKDPVVPPAMVALGESVSPRAVTDGWLEVVDKDSGALRLLPLVNDMTGELYFCPAGSTHDPRYCVDSSGIGGIVEQFRKEEKFEDGTTATCTVRRISGEKVEIRASLLHVQCQTLPGWCLLGHCGRKTLWVETEDSTVFTGEYRAQFDERWKNRERNSLGGSVVSTGNDLDTYNPRGFRDVAARRKPP